MRSQGEMWLCDKPSKDRAHIRGIAEKALEWAENGFLNQKPVAYGGNNYMYSTTDPGIKLRRAIKSSTSGHLRRYENSELAIQEVLGEARIGPAVFWHKSIVSKSTGKAEFLVLEAWGKDGDLQHFLSHNQAPAVLDLLARKIIKLLCRVAFLGFLALDMKPENIVISYDSSRTSHLCVRLIDFDPQFFRKVFNPNSSRSDEEKGALAAVSFRVMFKLLYKHLFNKKQNYRDFSRILSENVGTATSRFRRKDVERVLYVIDQTPNDVWKHYFKTQKPQTPEQAVGLTSVVSSDPNGPVRVGNFNFLSQSSIGRCLSHESISKASGILHRLSSEDSKRTQ